VHCRLTVSICLLIANCDVVSACPDSPDAPDVVGALQEANGLLQAENAELKAQLAEQAEKIARLERLISRNSGNSSMPPSTDDLPGKKLPERKARRAGGRAGYVPSVG
jgi:Family of unknown function (DUF6444)